MSCEERQFWSPVQLYSDLVGVYIMAAPFTISVATLRA